MRAGPQQELDGTVEADVRQGRLVARGSLERDARWTEAQEVDAGVDAAASRQSCRHQARRIFRQIARKYRGLGAAVVTLAAQALAGQGYADNAGQPLPALACLRLARRPERGQRHRLHLRSGKCSSRDGLVGQQPHDRLEPVVAGVMEMVGLGGGEQQPVDPAGKHAGEPCVGAGPEAFEDRLHAALQIGERTGAGVDGRERIDEHDLPVESGKVVAEERLHHVRLVALEAARQ